MALTCARFPRGPSGSAAPPPPWWAREGLPPSPAAACGPDCDPALPRRRRPACPPRPAASPTASGRDARRGVWGRGRACERRGCGGAWRFSNARRGKRNRSMLPFQPSLPRVVPY